MFPGGSGRLRMVEAQKPERVLGGADAERTGGRRGRRREARTAEAAEEAEIEEEDPADTAGVEIEVTPAGKATRRLSLLSGGEKSLVALAFVFSVFLARPSPFYILDEVEAALDDANIDRFLQLVRRFSDRAQFVIVTHQKRTMDAADVLYGVSMKDGATKVISRRLPREQKLAEAGPDSPRRVGCAADADRPGQSCWSWASGKPPPTRRLRQTASAATRRGAGRVAAGSSAGCARASRRAARRSAPSSAASLFENLDAEAWERLEEALIMADVGARTTAEVVGRLEGEVDAGKVEGAEAIRARLVELLADLASTGNAARSTCAHDPPSC